MRASLIGVEKIRFEVLLGCVFLVVRDGRSRVGKVNACHLFPMFCVCDPSRPARSGGDEAKVWLRWCELTEFASCSRSPSRLVAVEKAEVWWHEGRDGKQLKALGKLNSRLRKRVAEQALDMDILG